jgi:hypothetical protein
VAIVEAKPFDAEFTEGVAQAKNYAGKMPVLRTCDGLGWVAAWDARLVELR